MTRSRLAALAVLLVTSVGGAAGALGVAHLVRPPDPSPAEAWVLPASAAGPPGTVRAWHPWSATTAAGVRTTCVSSKDAAPLPPLTTP